MAKISELPELFAPTGDETAVVEVGGVTRRASLRTLFRPAGGARPTLGEMAGYCRIIPNPINGAVGITRGLRFPAGAGSGSTLYVSVGLLDADRRVMPVGSRVTVLATFTVTTGFAEDVGPSNDAEATFYVNDGDSFGFDGGAVDHAQSGFVGVATYTRATTWTWTAANKWLGQRLQFDALGAFAGTHDIQLASLTIVVDAIPALYATTVADLIRQCDEERARYGFAQQLGVGPGLPHGALQDLSPAELAQWAGVRTRSTRLRLALRAAEIVANNVALPPFVDIYGRERDRSRIVNFLPDNAAPAAIEVFEILRLDYSCRVEGVGGYIRNGRYFCHIEGAGHIRDQRIEIHNVDWRHAGNAGARQYQASVGASASAVFASTVPLGIGTGSGIEVVVTDSRLSGEAGAILIHDNGDFERPCLLHVENSELLPDSLLSPFLSVTTLGSFVDSTVAVVGNSVRGQLSYQGASPWVHADPAKNPADHSQFKISGRGNSPFGFVISDPGRCLRIRHATAGQPFILVEGSAVPLILGPADRNRTAPGAAGFRATFDGYLDIKGGVYTAARMTIRLGERLGDRRGSPVQMTVTAAGQAPITITFDQDHRQQSNATIIAAINAALGGVATAFEHNPGERYRPRFTDWERSMRNTGALAILMGTLVAWTEGGFICRNAEPGDELAGSGIRTGIALEDIVPGAMGRIQTGGLVNIEHILGDSYDPAAIQVGDTFKPVQVQNPAVDYYQAKGVLQRRGDGLGALRCVRPRMEANGFSSPAFLELR
jgi:hypothetical protein